MNTRLLTQEERFELVMECRSSGLSDYQWCQEKGINPGTFYNWIARFRKERLSEYSRADRQNIQV